ncbi:DUF6448 family protein [bacterium]|nr:DUF6448 family protein [bacterium]
MGRYLVILAALGLILMARTAGAHCDTMDGPVVRDAQTALKNGDITPVLKWIRTADEKEIREMFRKTLIVRTRGDDARELADMYFFETLVRVHRAGEGEPYTGLKPAGSEVEPGIKAADDAIDKGSVDELIETITRTVTRAIREGFNKVEAAKAHKDENVAAGRKFVAAYVSFIHFVEGIHAATASAPAGEKHQH